MRKAWRPFARPGNADARRARQAGRARRARRGGEPLTAQGSANKVITWYVLSR